MLNPACLSRPRELMSLIRHPVYDLLAVGNYLYSLVNVTNAGHPDHADLVKARDEVDLTVLNIKEIEETAREVEEGNQRNLAIIAHRLNLMDKFDLQIIKSGRWCV